jgi:hypothetical protein
LLALRSARAKGQDSAKLQVLVQTRSALELYGSAHNGTYPAGTNLDVATLVNNFLLPYLKSVPPTLAGTYTLASNKYTLTASTTDGLGVITVTSGTATIVTSGGGGVPGTPVLTLTGYDSTDSYNSGTGFPKNDNMTLVLTWSSSNATSCTLADSNGIFSGGSGLPSSSSISVSGIVLDSSDTGSIVMTCQNSSGNSSQGSTAINLQ